MSNAIKIVTKIEIKKFDPVVRKHVIYKEDKIFPYYETRKDVFGDILGWILPLVIFIGIWIFIMRRMSGGGAGAGGQIFSIGKSRRIYEKYKKINETN